jgi:thioester reductase-like protein
VEEKDDPAVATAETFVEPELSLGAGYSQAKWVAERILELAASETPLRPVVVRTTLIAGGLNGYWKADEWMPSIVESAMFVKCLPAMESVRSLADLFCTVVDGWLTPSREFLGFRWTSWQICS